MKLFQHIIDFLLHNQGLIRCKIILETGYQPEMSMEKSDKKGLNVKKGVETPGIINPKLSKHKRKPLPNVKKYVEGILNGDRILLSQAITLVESNRKDHQLMAEQIVEACLPHSGNSIRIGITGTPGVGKSTFIEALGKLILKDEKKIAVLAIDPSSQVSHGSILGDKTRMEELSANPLAFIRPSPAGESLGGVARKTRETILLCEAAGFETIIVETVGVGQSETVVHSMVDFFLLLLLPGGGDELQGIKRGVVEMADLIAINKADGKNVEKAKHSRQSYRNALHLFPPKESGWVAQAKICSALSGNGLPEIWHLIEQYREFTVAKGFFESNRSEQSSFWLYQSMKDQLQNELLHHKAVKQALPDVERLVATGKLSPFKGARQLLESFFKVSGKQ